MDIDKPYAFATTEVMPIKGKEDISDKYCLFYFLLKDDIRSLLTGKMEGHRETTVKQNGLIEYFNSQTTVKRTKRNSKYF